MRRIFSGRERHPRRREPSRRRGLRERPAPGEAAAGPPGLRSLRSELDRLFDRFFGPERGWRGGPAAAGAGWSPSVDVVDADREFTVRAEMPGLDPEDIRVSVVGDVLVLAGEKRDEHEDKWKGFVRSERRYGAFRKLIPIPAGADPDRVTADYDRGVLTVHLPKSEARKPRPITISGPRRPPAAPGHS